MGGWGGVGVESNVDSQVLVFVVVVVVLRLGAAVPRLVHHRQPVVQVGVEPDRGPVAVHVQQRTVVGVHLLGRGRRHRDAYRGRLLPGQRLALPAPRRRFRVPQLVVVYRYEQRRDYRERYERYTADQQPVLQHHERHRSHPEIDEKLEQHTFRQMVESLPATNPNNYLLSTRLENSNTIIIIPVTVLRRIGGRSGVPPKKLFLLRFEELCPPRPCAKPLKTRQLITSIATLLLSSKSFFHRLAFGGKVIKSLSMLKIRIGKISFPRRYDMILYKSPARIIDVLRHFTAYANLLTKS